MKIKNKTEVILTIERKNFFIFLIALLAIFLVIIFVPHTLLGIGIALVIFIAFLFIPFKHTIIADKNQQALIVVNTALARKTQRAVALGMISKLQLTIQRSLSMGSGKSPKSRTHVEFFALLNEQAQGDLMFALPAPRIQNSMGSISGMMTAGASRMKNYAALEELAQFIGVPLEKSVPSGVADIAHGLMNRRR